MRWLFWTRYDDARQDVLYPARRCINAEQERARGRILQLAQAEPTRPAGRGKPRS